VRFCRQLSAQQFDDMQYSELVFYSRLLMREKAEKYKDGLKFAAFTVWQQGHSGKSFKEYLIDLQLEERQVISKEKRQSIIKKAYDKTADILKRLGRT
jgi:hypothetical protein